MPTCPCPCVQVTVDYVAMTPQGKVFDSSLEKGRPYDVRIGSGQVCQLDNGRYTSAGQGAPTCQACLHCCCCH